MAPTHYLEKGDGTQVPRWSRSRRACPFNQPQTITHERRTTNRHTCRAAPDFKQVRSYLRTIEQREALVGFIRAGWSPTELAEFARAVYLAPGKTYPTAASYQYATEKRADHPYAVETLTSLRAPGSTMPPFDRLVPKEYEWDDPDNPKHTAELRAEIEVMGRLWRNREASFREEPWPTKHPLIPRTLWSRLFRLRNRYHSLMNTVQFEGLLGFSEPSRSY
ncbi:hypothetical protein XH99_14380 [Bradyrhizobium nanningense]|uniref:Uncharacterized protein n=1 Tax=Bradyrhizobium nanningense TaxID=1325118 RepID=A0A4Q0S8B3_9BRAD|nr:hypothetical protein XH99_14380 [Bradyrhizobium nanningense]